MTQINWNLVNPANIQSGFMQSVQQGMAMGQAAAEARERKEFRGALAVLATEPENQSALAAVFQRDPRLGADLMDRAESRAFGRDTADMLQPSPYSNALLGATGAPASQVAAPRNALLSAAPAATGMPPVAAGASFDQAFAPMATPVAGQAPQPAPDSPEGEVADIDLSSLGEAKTRSDEAFLRMVRRDPIKALQIKSALRDNFVAQVKAESDLYGLAIGELSRATDQNTWEAGLRNVMPRAQTMGVDLMSVVPMAYPGPEGLAQLMERAQPVKEQLDFMLREANIDADNERADRNVDSQIEIRERRAGEYERANQAREGNQRRGQDVASTDRRRGQNITSRDRVRGQGARVVEAQTPADAAKLKPGTVYRTPDGQVRVR